MNNKNIREDTQVRPLAQEAKKVTVGKVPKEDMQRLKVLQGNMQRFEVLGGDKRRFEVLEGGKQRAEQGTRRLGMVVERE